MTERKMPFLNKWAFRLWWLPRMLMLLLLLLLLLVLPVLVGLAAIGIAPAQQLLLGMFALLERWLTEIKTDAERLSRPINKEGG